MASVRDKVRAWGHQRAPLFSGGMASGGAAPPLADEVHGAGSVVGPDSAEHVGAAPTFAAECAEAVSRLRIEAAARLVEAAARGAAAGGGSLQVVAAAVAAAVRTAFGSEALGAWEPDVRARLQVAAPALANLCRGRPVGEFASIQL